MKLDNKTALITGGTSGIGLATARLFLDEGARVVITGRDQQRLEVVGRELGPNVLALQADTTDVAALDAAMQAIHQRWDKLDVVFANAGSASSTPLGSTSLEAFEATLRVNVTGVFFTVQEALPYLNDGASVILNGSVIALMGQPERAAYAASKGAVRSMARVLATELSPRNIRVNVMVPGATRTPIWSSAAPTADAMTALERRLSRSIPLQRMGEAEEIAKAVLFLASDDASFIQGAEIVVDGGATGAPGGAPVYRQAS